MKTKTICKIYPAWAYAREVENNNALSREGWQLTRCGCFASKYVFDDSVQYRYALDFDQNITDPDRYRETFAEQGWEFLNSTFNGWHWGFSAFSGAWTPSMRAISLSTLAPFRWGSSFCWGRSG